MEEAATTQIQKYYELLKKYDELVLVNHALNVQVQALESNKVYLKESKTLLRSKIKGIHALYLNKIGKSNGVYRELRAINAVLREDLRGLPFFKKLKILFFN